MADWVDSASRPFKIHSGEAIRRQIRDGDAGNDNLVFDVLKELVDVDVEESYVDNGVRDSVADEMLNKRA